MDDFLDRETGIEAELAKDQPRRAARSHISKLL